VILKHDRRKVKDTALPNTLPILSTGGCYPQRDWGTQLSYDFDSKGTKNSVVRQASQPARTRQAGMLRLPEPRRRFDGFCDFSWKRANPYL